MLLHQIVLKLNWIPATFWRKLEQYKHSPFYLWEQRDGVLYLILSTNTQICEDDPVLQRTWSGGSLSRWVTTARTSVHFLLPTTRVIFAAISSCRNIALIPILSVAARFGSLWSLNNFAGLCFPPHCICISLLPCLLSSQLGYLPSCNLFVMAYPYCLLRYTHTLPKGYHPQMSCNQDYNREIREISLRLYLRIILWHHSSGFTSRISLCKTLKRCCLKTPRRLWGFLSSTDPSHLSRFPKRAVG